MPAHQHSARVAAAAATLIAGFVLASAGEKPPEYRPDRIIVKPRAEVRATRPDAVAAAHAAVRARVHRDYPGLRGIQVLQLPPGLGVEQAIAYYKRTGVFEYAQPDYIVTIAATPNDPRFLDGSLWGLHNTGQNGGTADADIDAPEAWDVRTNAETVVVAVIDTGVDYTHPDLASNMWINVAEIAGNGIDDDGNGYTDDVYGINAITGSGNPLDDHFHGTHCAGTIGAVGNNGIGVVGVAWRVRIMALKFLNSGGTGSLSDAIECINYAIHKGAHIMSNSWGCQGCFDQALEDAIGAAAARGIIFVAAAGNSAANIDTTPFYPAAHTNDNLVSVAATDRNDLLAGFSNYGAVGVDLGAPGVAIWSTYPTYTTPATSITNYNAISGTSMACPHVSGALALLKAQYPVEQYAQLIERVLLGVDPIPSLAGKCQSDGRLNLHKALTQSIDLRVTPRPVLSITGPDGGPFTPSGRIYTLVNAGSNSLDWTAASNVAWLDLAPSSGTLAPGTTNTVTASLNATANTLLPGTYSATVTFSNLTGGAGLLRRVSLQILDSLLLSPATEFVSSGPQGGPFAPPAQSYVLSNRAVSARSWTASKSAGWLELSATAGSLAAGAKTNVTVSVNALANMLASGIYTDTVTFLNLATASNQTRRAVLRVEVDDFTEWFTAGDNDLDNLSLTFIPNGSFNFYRACTTPASGFAVDPAGGTIVSLSDDSFVQVTLSGAAQLSLYGTNYSSLFIGSNGYITFGSGDSTYTETLTNHFNRPRISALFDDLNPGSAGTVSWKQLADRVAVTWQNVPEFATSNTNSFQIEMFFDGRIRITYLTLAATDGLAGLSRGAGVPPGFAESDLSAYPPCNLAPVVLRAEIAPAADAFSDESLVLTNVVVTDAEADPVTLAYQWQFSSNGVAFVDQAGATATSLPAAPGNSGKLWRCRLTPGDAWGTGTNFFTGTVAVNNRPNMLGRHGQFYSYDSDLFIASAGGGPFSRDALINEFSQGNGGNKEWVEVLFLKDSDARGWRLADNTTTVTFSGAALWSNVAAGTLLVVYNGADRDTTPPLPADDLDPSDGILIIPHNHPTYFSGSWGGLSNTGDQIGLLDASSTLIHGLSYGNNTTYSTPKLGNVGSHSSASYTNNTETGVTTNINWRIIPAASATPAAGNGTVNSNFIAQIRSGAFNQIPLFRFAAGADAVPGLSIDATNGLVHGILNAPTGGFYNVVIERYLGTNVVSQHYNLLVGDSNDVFRIGAGSTWAMNTNYTIPGTLLVQGRLDTRGHTLIVSNTLDVASGIVSNATGLIRYHRLVGSPLPGASEQFNSLPVIAAASISPARPRLEDDLVATVTSASDADGDPISFAYQWQQSADNVSFEDIGATSNTLSSSALTAGSYYRVRITPHDGIAAGPPFTTASVRPLLMQITDVHSGGADVLVSFVTFAGETYQVQYTDNPAGGIWTVLTNNVAGTGGIVTVTDPGAAALPQRFYRVKLLP